jgi:hypothetical protein
MCLPGAVDEHRIGFRGVEHQVPVVAPRRGETCVETGFGPLRTAHRDVRAAHRVHAVRQRLEIGSRRQVAADDLAATVHTRVGAAGHGELDRCADHGGHGTHQLAGDRGDTLVRGETVERAAVVRHNKTGPP